MGRKRAREEFFKLLFEADMKDVLPSEVLDTYLKYFPEELDEEENFFIKEYAKNISDKFTIIDDIIKKNMRNWKLDRIGTVERVLLRMAVYELISEEDIGYKIVINEALELAKKYGDDKSHEFINGVLANVITQNKKG